jgi:hypothetical protein
MRGRVWQFRKKTAWLHGVSGKCLLVGTDPFGDGHGACGGGVKFLLVSVGVGLTDFAYR